MNYGYVIMFAGLAIVAAVYVYDLVCAGRLWRLVKTNLDNALEGGRFGCESGYLFNMTALEVAADMELYCEDASGYDRNELLPHVERWMRERGV